MKTLALWMIFLAACGGSTPSLTLPDPGKAGFPLRINSFPVASGQEIQNCYFFAVPGTPDQEVWINHYQLSSSIGTHHVNVFRVNTIVNLSGKPGDEVSNGECFTSSNWADWPLVINSQDGGKVIDWTLPEGVGQKLHGGDLLMMQVHFVNATTQKTPGLADAAVNFYTMPAAAPMEMGTLFATYQHIKICPGDTDVSFNGHCTFQSNGVKVIAANGHFHSRGIDFQIWPIDSMGTRTGNTFYESTTWNDPPMTRGLDVDIPASGGVDWQCSYTAAPDSCGDPTNNCCFTFGGKVETQEHCNAFVYYYPMQNQTDINCF